MRWVRGVLCWGGKDSSVSWMLGSEAVVHTRVRTLKKDEQEYPDHRSDVTGSS